jgi:NTE family protein
MTNALVLSAGGMWAAWEVGAWRVLRDRFEPDLIVGASAGAWNGWAIAGGASPDELVSEWMNPLTAELMRSRPQALEHKAREIFARYQPRKPYLLTLVEVPRLKPLVVSAGDITWRHIVASGSIPCVFPPVAIDGRYYVDGGLRGGLPLWAAEEAGATRAIALNVLNTRLFRTLRRFWGWKKASPAMEVVHIEPSRPLGSLYDAVVWNARNIERWIAQGERDALQALSSVRM